MADYSLEEYLTVRTAGAPTLNASADRIAYLSNDDTDTHQIYLRSFDQDDARRVTGYDDGIGFVEYSPTDDRLLIFSKDSGGNENYDLFFMDTYSGAVTPLTDDPKTQFVFGGWSRDGKTILYSSNARNGADRDIFLYDCASAKSTLLHEGTGWTYSGGFSPSGRYVVFGRMYGNDNNDLYLIDRENPDEPRLLTRHDGTVNHGSPVWLNDESGFFVRSNQGGEFSDLYFYDLATGSMTLVLEYDWDIESVVMTRPGDLMLVWVNEDGYSKLHHYAVNGRELEEAHDAFLPDGEIYSIEFSNDASRAVYAHGAYNEVGNVWAWDRGSGRNRQLTDLTLAADTKTFVEPVLDHYRSFDGLESPVFVHVPVTPGPFPAIVLIHGGPEGQYRPGFTALTQYWVSRGFAVIAPNVRGSSGYGKRYMSLDDRTKRLDSVADLRALHEWAAADPRFDAERLALMGGSYGGYMVLAGLAFQPELWAAGVDTVGIANFVTFLQNTSPYRRKLREAEYGSLDEDREFLESASPINKIDQITAPLFIVHGRNDPRVPLDEAHQMHDSLMRRGVESELLIYDDEGHGIAKLNNRLDMYPRIARFLEGILAPQPDEAPHS